MLKADAFAHFKGNQSAIARAISITRASVNGWGEIVPLDKALKLQAATRGALKVDLSLYEGTVEKTLFDFGRRSGRRQLSA